MPLWCSCGPLCPYASLKHWDTVLGASSCLGSWRSVQWIYMNQIFVCLFGGKGEMYLVTPYCIFCLSFTCGIPKCQIKILLCIREKQEKIIQFIMKHSNCLGEITLFRMRTPDYLWNNRIYCVPGNWVDIIIRLQIWYIVCWKTLALTSLFSKAIQVLPPLLQASGFFPRRAIPIYSKGNFA